MTFTEDEIKQFKKQFFYIPKDDQEASDCTGFHMAHIENWIKAHDKRLIERFIKDYMIYINVVKPESTEFIKRVSLTLNEYLGVLKPLEVTK